jgi:hypothetical protein
VGIEKCVGVEWSWFRFFSITLCERRHVEAFCNLETPKTHIDVPLQAWTGPWISRRLRLPEVLENRYTKWQGCHPYAPAAFNPKRHPCYPFVFEAELTTRATRMTKSMKVSNDPVGNWTHSASTNCVTACPSYTLMLSAYYTVHFASDEVLTLITLHTPLCLPQQIEYSGIYIHLQIPVNLRRFTGLNMFW